MKSIDEIRQNYFAKLGFFKLSPRCLPQESPTPTLSSSKVGKNQHDAVLRSLQTRNLALRSLNSPQRWNEFYAELKDLSLLRRQKVKCQGLGEYKASYKVGAAESQGDLVIHVKKIPDFDKKPYVYLTPASFSLVPAFGKMNPYGSPEDYQSWGGRPWINTGILVNIQNCKQKPHIYKGDGCTGSYIDRSWDVHYMAIWEEAARKRMKEKMLADPASELCLESEIQSVFEENSKVLNLSLAQLDRDRHITLDTLRQQTAENKTYHYNEMLLSLQAKAIVGVYAYQIPSPKDNQTERLCNLASKIDALYHQDKLVRDNSVHVPVYLMDPEQGMLLYSAEQQDADFKSLNVSDQDNIIMFLTNPSVQLFARGYIQSMAQPVTRVTLRSRL